MSQLILLLDLVVIFRVACTTVSILFRNLNVSSLLKISVHCIRLIENSRNVNKYTVYLAVHSVLWIPLVTSGCDISCFVHNCIDIFQYSEGV